MKLKRVSFQDIKEESHYIVRYGDWESDLEIVNGIEIVFHICQYFNIEDEEIKDYDDLKNTLNRGDEGTGDVYFLKIYELIP
jgi:hypothetical protein